MTDTDLKLREFTQKLVINFAELKKLSDDLDMRMFSTIFSIVAKALLSGEDTFKRFYDSLFQFVLNEIEINKKKEGNKTNIEDYKWPDPPKDKNKMN